MQAEIEECKLECKPSGDPPPFVGGEGPENWGQEILESSFGKNIFFDKSLNIQICLCEFTCEKTKIENMSVWKNMAYGSEKILIRTWLC